MVQRSARLRLVPALLVLAILAGLTPSLPAQAVSIQTLPLESAPLKTAEAPLIAQSVPDSQSQRERDPALAEPALDLNALRSETIDRLRLLDAVAVGPDSRIQAKTQGAGPRAGNAGLRELLEERQKRLEEHDRATAELRQVTETNLGSDRQAATARVEHERVQTQLSQPAEKLIPRVFRIAAKDVTEATRGEMKDAIDTAQTDLKEWQAKLEGERGEAATAVNTQQSLSAECDRRSHQVASLRSRIQEQTTAVNAAATLALRQLAKERGVNIKLEAVVEALWLKVVEAKITRETKHAQARKLRLLEFEARVELSRRLLEQMQHRYRDLAESKQRNLEQAAAKQASKAQQSADLLDRYRARRQASFLELRRGSSSTSNLWLLGIPRPSRNSEPWLTGPKRILPRSSGSWPTAM